MKELPLQVIKGTDRNYPGWMMVEGETGKFHITIFESKGGVSYPRPKRSMSFGPNNSDEL